MIAFTKLLFFASTWFLISFSLILRSSSDISVRGNAFTWQRKSWIIFSPFWNGRRRRRKQNGCLDPKQNFSKFPRETNHYSSAETYCRQNLWLPLHLLLHSPEPRPPVYTVISSLPFQSMSKRHQLIRKNAILNTESSWTCSTLNSSVWPRQIANNNSIREAALSKLIAFCRNCKSKPTFQYAKGKNKL